MVAHSGITFHDSQNGEDLLVEMRPFVFLYQLTVNKNKMHFGKVLSAMYIHVFFFLSANYKETIFPKSKGIIFGQQQSVKNVKNSPNY